MARHFGHSRELSLFGTASFWGARSKRLVEPGVNLPALPKCVGINISKDHLDWALAQSGRGCFNPGASEASEAVSIWVSSIIEKPLGASGDRNRGRSLRRRVLPLPDRSRRDDGRRADPVQRTMIPLVEQHFHLVLLVPMLENGILGSSLQRTGSSMIEVQNLSKTYPLSRQQKKGTLASDKASDKAKVAQRIGGFVPTCS